MAAKGTDDGSSEDSLIVPFFVGRRRLRIHIGGRRDALRQFAVAAADLQHGGTDEASIIADITSLAAELGLIVADILDVSPASPPVFDVGELLMRAAQRPTAEQAWLRIQAVLTSATDDELDRLMQPEQLSRVRPVLRSVLDDLDENRFAAEAQLRQELSPRHCYMLLS